MLVSSYDPAVLQRFADVVRQHATKGSLDAVVLTGDIATTGDIEELENALEFIEAPPDFRQLAQTAAKEPTLGCSDCKVEIPPTS
ncbi:MAG TPA: metallophosphoesterase [Pyrinomonadaceae bacterium]|nr:metallophosphoesterase [Pyrinomonadaceae bacterium]